MKYSITYLAKVSGSRLFLTVLQRHKNNNRTLFETFELFDAPKVHEKTKIIFLRYYYRKQLQTTKQKNLDNFIRL